MEFERARQVTIAELLESVIDPETIDDPEEAEDLLKGALEEVTKKLNI